MRIKLLNLFYVIFVVMSCVACVAHGGACSKAVEDTDGMALRNRDIAAYPAIATEVTSFVHGICNNPGHNQYCVKIDTVSVHSMEQAIYIAKEWAQEKNNAIITCDSKYYTRCGDRNTHLLCKTVPINGTVPRDYEFVFKNITEKSDNVFFKGLGLGFCKIYGDETANVYPLQSGGTFSYELPFSTGYMCKPYYDIRNAHSGADNQLAKLKATLNKYFSWNVELNSQYKTANVTILDNDLCEDSDMNMDTRFAGHKADLNTDFVVMLAQYTARQMSKQGQQLSSFKCDLAPSTCKKSMMDYRNVLTCYANGTIKKKFMFKTLSTSRETAQAATAGALQCMSLTDSGTFDGRRCQGIDYDTCINKLGSVIDGGTTWDDDVGCILNAANTYAKQERAVQIAAGVGVTLAIIAVSIVVPVAGGTALAAAAGETGFLLGVISLEAAVNQEIITDNEREIFARHTAQLAACANTDNNCIKRELEAYLTTLNQYREHLEPNQIDAFDDILSEKIKYLPDEYIESYSHQLDDELSRSTLDRVIEGDWSSMAPEEKQRAVFKFIEITAGIFSLSGTVKKAFTSVNKTKNLTKTFKELVAHLQKINNVTDRVGDYLTAEGTVATVTTGAGLAYWAYVAPTPAQAQGAKHDISPQEQECIDSHGEWKGDKCDCPSRKFLTNQTQTKCACKKEQGIQFKWNNQRKMCLIDNETIEQIKSDCDKSHGEWQNGPTYKCKCPSSKSLTNATRFKCACAKDPNSGIRLKWDERRNKCVR